ncbi:MAG: hypothetical protein Q9216_003877 [Gyalolechia sp. 2 TL-2023]
MKRGRKSHLLLSPLDLLILPIFFNFISLATGLPQLPPSSTSITAATASPVQCVDHETWLAEGFVKEDCYVAVQDLYTWDFRWNPDEAFRFFSGGATSHPERGVATPRRYSKSSCTLVLITLNRLSTYELPGNLPHGNRPVDKATFREIYLAARALEERCVASIGKVLEQLLNVMNYDLKGKSPAISVGSLVLVTGVNGYIGSHVADQLVQAGYRVRGTVRDESKGQYMKEFFDKKYGDGKLETVVVADMSQAGAFDEACKGASGVAHVASDLSFAPDPHQVIPGVIAGAMNAVSAAAKQPSVKRFVYTSSSAAISAAKPNVEFTISTRNWNDEDIAKAWAPPPYNQDRSMAVYGASKAQAEQEAWKFVREQKPAFVLNAVLPNFNLGVILSDKQFASTGGAVRDIFQNGELGFWSIFPAQWMVDVQDTARLHVAALIDPDIKDQRILAYGHPFSFNDVLASLRKLYPSKSFPEDNEDLGRDVSIVDNSQGAELLRRFGRDGWASFEESMKNNLSGIPGA